MDPIHYAIREEDQLAFADLHFRASVPRFLLAGGLAVAALLAMAFAVDGAEAAWAVSIGGAIGLALMYALIRYIFVPRHARRAWRDFALIQEPIDLTLGEDGFTLNQASAHVEARWEHMIAWDEDKRVLAIYVTRQQAYILPKDQVGAAALEYARERLIESGLIAKGKRRKWRHAIHEKTVRRIAGDRHSQRGQAQRDFGAP